MQIFNKISNLYFRLVTQIAYRPFFKSMGRASVIRKPILISGAKYMSIGDAVTIRDHARLEVIKTSSTRTPSLTIGQGTNIEQNVHIVCGNRIAIGANVSITANCAIVDVTHPYDDIEGGKVGSRVLDADSFVEIGDNTMLGIGVVVLPNVRIGKHCVIGANSVVSRDIPDYSIAAGSPAKVIKRYDANTKEWVRV